MVLALTRPHSRMNWHRDDQPIYGCIKRTDFFAPKSLETPDGRRVMWAWLTSVGLDDMLLDKTIQSLPRELNLSADNRLLIKPLDELKTLRYEPVTLSDIVLSHPVTNNGANVPPAEPPFRQKVAELEGDSLEIRIVIPRKEALQKLLGFILFGNRSDGGLPVLLRPETGTLRIGNTEAPFSVFDLPEGEDVELRIFIDKYLVEVFANNRQAVVAGRRAWGDRPVIAS